MMVTKQEIIHRYNHSHDYGMSKSEFMLFALLHIEGNEAVKTIIEDILTDINLHSEVAMFKRGEEIEAVCQWD